DQLVQRQINKDYKFYGNSSEAMEKRNRVKVRMMANTLQTLIQDSSKVILMPHQEADYDAIGACLGMAKFASLNNKEVFICSTLERMEKGTADAYRLLELNKFNLLAPSNDILDMIDDETLLIVLDTSNIEIFESQEVYESVEKRVVIDHHRKSKDFIKNPLLVYIEPYASSTVELVTELLRFQNKSFKLDCDVATLMLAGMMVDTSFFTVRTGVRTFEAATILKDNGASPLQAKEILQVSRDTYQKKLAIVSDAQFIKDNIAISKYTDEPVSRTLLAQAAVELLDVKDTVATFVMGYLEDGSIGLSARSNGDFNVQRIVEHYGGGGHFSMAATQINGNINEVEKDIVAYIEEVYEEVYKEDD
ncbi:MAG: DHH family phosphoesterase, partial [Erysipelotrichales bacterium]